MKTLFIHNTLPEYRIDFMQKLSQMCEVTFLITDTGKASQIYGFGADTQRNGFKVLSAPKNRITAYVKTLLKEGGYSSVVLPPADNIALYWIGLFTLRNCLKRNVRTVYWSEKWEAVKDLQPWTKKIKNAVHRLMIGSLARRCDVCIASGSRAKEYFMRLRIDEHKIRTAYDSSTSPTQDAIPDLREQLGIPPESKVILYLGRLVERKGCDLLIEAYKRIRQKRNDVWLLIGGAGEEAYERCCRALAEGQAQVKFLGLIQPRYRRNYYQLADVFVLPSYSLGGVIEAWGLTVNEALECGTPVVATTAVGSAYDLLDGRNGIMVDEKNVDRLAEGIERILRADQATAFEACIAAAARFSTQNMAKEFAQALAPQEGK